MSPTITRAPNFLDQSWLAILGFVSAALILTVAANGQIDGLTEPFKRIELSSDESGSVAQMNVKEGDQVAAGEAIARLDHRVQKLQFEIAQQLAKSESQLMAASKTAEKRQAILERLRKLQQKGHASESEVIRAEMELSIAAAKLLSAQEDQAVRKLEMKRAKVQLARRTITAPFAGTISKVHRREGEYLSPLNPEIATLIQVDRLLATFAVSGGSRPR